jgi:hypothetical protein
MCLPAFAACEHQVDVLDGFGADVDRIHVRRGNDFGRIGGCQFAARVFGECGCAGLVAVARGVVIDVERRGIGAGTGDVADVAGVEFADEAATDQANAERHAVTLCALWIRRGHYLERRWSSNPARKTRR